MVLTFLGKAMYVASTRNEVSLDIAGCLLVLVDHYYALWA
jgi:hypothetical protein